MTILVVQIQTELAHFLKQGLEREYYLVELAATGEEALDKAGVNDYDVIIMDVKLPKIDGVEVCKRLREMAVISPIIMVSQSSETDIKVNALDAGADDYLTVPFSFTELLARIRALLRREKKVEASVLKVGDLTLDTAAHEVRRGGKPINLSKKEYRLLDYMMRRPGRVCTRTMLGEHVWGYHFSDYSNVMDVYISRLRKKVDKGFGNKLIHTVRDVGYKIEDKSVLADRRGA